MQTPSLRHRVTATVLVVVAGLLLAMDVLLFVGLRSELTGGLDEVLDARARTALSLAQETPPEQLAERLQRIGITAVVTTPDGDSFESEPASPRFGAGAIATTLASPRVGTTVMAPDGTEVTVLATRAGVDAALRRVILVEVLGTAVALLASVLLLRRASSFALRPLDEVVATLTRVTSGGTGERLRPDRPDTEIGRLATSFDTMLDALEAAVEDAQGAEARSQRFLADAAHQLRTPLAGLRATVELLLREQTPEDRDRGLGVLIRETGRASRIVSSLLTIARIDRNLEPNASPTDLVALCRTEVERAQALAPHLDVELHLGTASVAPLEAEAEAIQEAVANLLDNARRHARTRVVVTLDRLGESFAITVTDDGPGVPPDLRTAIFERFASHDGKGGSGLGLPIARGVARAHSGDLVYADGAFQLTLPVERVPEPVSATPRA